MGCVRHDKDVGKCFEKTLSSASPKTQAFVFCEFEGCTRWILCGPARLYDASALEIVNDAERRLLWP